MKIIVILLTCGILGYYQLAQAYEYSAEQKKLIDTCAQESKLTPDEIAHVQGSSSSAAPVSKNMQCYKLCFYKKMGIVDQNDKPDGNKMQQGLMQYLKDEKKVTDILTKCGTLTGADACEKAFNFDKCITDNTK